MKSSFGIAALSLLIGIGIGTSVNGPAQAEETTRVSTALKEDSLKVCIDKKTGAIRAASKCKPTERLYVLGGPGPRGPQGEVGPQGATGLQGTPGIKGVDGKSADLKLKTINFLASSSCAGVLDGFELPIVNRIDEYITTRTYARHFSGTLRGCSISVYVP